MISFRIGRKGYNLRKPGQFKSEKPQDQHFIDTKTT